MKQYASHLTMAASTLRPLYRLLHTLPDVPRELKERLAALNANDDRVLVSEGRELVEAIVRLTGDADLGLRAALFVRPSDFEVLESVAASAANWRSACETVCRYVRVLNETAQYRVEVCGDKAHVILGCCVPQPRATIDFQLASFHLAIQRWLPETWPELSVWMKQEQPADLAAYRALFPHCQLVFRAAFDGFVHDARRLETQLPTADPERHRVMAADAERLLERITPADSVVARTCRDILESMSEGRIAAERTAAQFHMARRTLVRMLTRHGTSYSELVKEVRYRTAMHYLQNTKHSVSDIAFLLGYSECAPFVRAFKRWSGLLPSEHRRMHATASPNRDRSPMLTTVPHPKLIAKRGLGRGSNRRAVTFGLSDSQRYSP
jgi:AraC-like DNA-binding protein